MSRFQPGEEILVAYDGYTVRGRFLREEFRGWIAYETLTVSNVEPPERYAGMPCEAAEEFCYREGEPRPDEPMLSIFKALRQ